MEASRLREFSENLYDGVIEPGDLDVESILLGQAFEQAAQDQEFADDVERRYTTEFEWLNRPAPDPVEGTIGGNDA